MQYNLLDEQLQIILHALSHMMLETLDNIGKTTDPAQKEKLHQDLMALSYTHSHLIDQARANS